MSQPCAIKTCKRASRTLCHCCNQNLCREHFNEHDDLLNSQLNPLTDEINVLSDRLTAFNLDKVTNESRQKLNQWRLDCYKTIDHFHDQKSQELDQYVTQKFDKQRKQITDLRSKMSELIDKQGTTKHDIESFTSAIHTLGLEMNEIEQLRVQIDVRALLIDNNSIQIGTINTYQFDLSTLSPPYRTITRSARHSHALAGNDRFLLVSLRSNLCLIDQEFSIIKQSEWDHNGIEDMCWSSVLNSFLIITNGDVILVNDKLLLIGTVQTMQRRNWWTVGCSNKSLYLSQNDWDSSVFEFSLLPSIEFVKTWKTSDTMRAQQRIDSIVYNDETLALAIKDQSNKVKLIELRSSKNFNPLWSLRLDLDYNSRMARCCSLNRNEWLLTDWCTSRLFHITKDGKLRGSCAVEVVPYYAKLFSSNILAILTHEGINFHKL